MISVDWTVSLTEAKARCGRVNPRVVFQGNLDPAVLLSGDEALIKARTEDILRMGGGQVIRGGS